MTDESEPAPPTPYTALELLSETLTVPFRPWPAFAQAAARPAPSGGALALNSAVYGAAFLALNLLHGALAFPAVFSTQPPERVLVVGAFALAGLMLLGVFFAVGVLAVAALTGGTGGFARGYQLVSMLGALAPIQAAALWYPPLTPIPAVLGALLAAAGLEKLFSARPLAARSLCAAALIVPLGGGWLAKRALDRAVAPYLELRRSLSDLQAQTRALPAPSPQPAETGTAGAANAASGLDLIGAPSGLQGPAAQTKPDALDSTVKAAAGAVDSVMPMLDDPRLTKGMPASQRAQMEQLTGMIKKMSAQMRAGKPLDPKEQAAMMQIIQQQMQNLPPGVLQQLAPGARPAAAAPAAPEGSSR